jgi:hypothetical protein
MKVASSQTIRFLLFMLRKKSDKEVSEKEMQKRRVRKKKKKKKTLEMATKTKSLL